MSDNENLVRRAEGVVGRRKLLMAVIIVGLCLTCGAMLMKHFSAVAPDPATTALLRHAGLAVVFAGIVGTAALRRNLKRHPDLSAMVNDERAERVRHQMFFYGYFVLLFGVVASILATVFGVIDAEAAFLIMLLAGGVTPPLMFIALR